MKWFASTIHSQYRPIALTKRESCSYEFHEWGIHVEAGTKYIAQTSETYELLQTDTLRFHKCLFLVYNLHLSNTRVFPVWLTQNDSFKMRPERRRRVTNAHPFLVLVSNILIYRALKAFLWSL